jgi:hypothetical protein
MDFVNEMGFDVKQGKAREFQEWLREHEKEFAEEAPEGWEYIGTYAVVLSTEKAGDFRQLWRHHSYAAMDTWAAAMQEGGPSAALYDEMFMRFVDQERGAPFSQSIYKAVVDASIWGE